MVLTWYSNKQKLLDYHKIYWYIIVKKFSELKNLGMMLCIINTFLNKSKSYMYSFSYTTIQTLMDWKKWMLILTLLVYT